MAGYCGFGDNNEKKKGVSAIGTIVLVHLAHNHHVPYCSSVYCWSLLIHSHPLLTALSCCA